MMAQPDGHRCPFVDFARCERRDAHVDALLVGHSQNAYLIILPGTDGIDGGAMVWRRRFTGYHVDSGDATGG